MSNEEILNKLKENINLQIGNFIYLMNEPLDRAITFKTGDNNVSLSPITRLPNNNEINDYLYDELRRLYFKEQRIITTVQYKTVKGQIRKDIGSAINFLRKQITDNDFYKDYISFINTEKTYLEGNIQIKFPQPISYAVIELDVDKEE